MSKRSVILIGSAVVVALVAVGGGIGWFYWTREQAKTDAARTAFTKLADAWHTGDVSQVAFTDDAAKVGFKDTFAEMGASRATVTPVNTTRSGNVASTTFEVSWPLSDKGSWRYTAPFGALYRDGTWQIKATGDHSLWVPEIGPKDIVLAKRVTGTRGDLLAADGKPLMPIGTVYPVQIDPARATPESAAGLERLTGEKGLTGKLAAAKKSGSKALIPVITYRQADFDKRRDRLDALVGVIYPRTTQPLAPSRTFGQPLLGSFGEVTADVVKGSNGRYRVGDRAGLSGLQGQYDAVLAGTPGAMVVSSANKVLSSAKATDGKDVQTGLDIGIQRAAESAVAKTGSTPSALVAIDVTSGQVRAVANNPSFGFDRASTGQYPPGSTMKVATTYALLTAGKVKPSTKVACPKTITVDGRSFRNYEGETLGSPTFGVDFAHSCNTAFIKLAEGLDNDAVTKAAKSLGVGGNWAKTVGVTGAYPGSVPVAKGATDKVAGAIGQGRDLASPMALATMAASVARGSYLPPALVFADEAASPKPAPLDAQATKQLRTMMGDVVTDGTAPVMRGTPGGPVFGKTGTAEYGNGNPPKTHAWFIGWQGDVAFAVLVEDGKAGGAVAAPIAKAFLTSLSK